jgi:hypothetical protein
MTIGLARIEGQGDPALLAHLRGPVQVGDVTGVAAEDVLAQHRYLGIEQHQAS